LRKFQENEVVLKFRKVTDTLLIYLPILLAYRDFWSEVSVTFRNKRKIDHYRKCPGDSTSVSTAGLAVNGISLYNKDAERCLRRTFSVP
jgi:hypothetical protein